MKYNQFDIFELVTELYNNIGYAKFYTSEMFDEINSIFDEVLSERDLLEDWKKHNEEQFDSKE